jgi:hypothetical protein
VQGTQVSYHFSCQASSCGCTFLPSISFQYTSAVRLLAAAGVRSLITFGYVSSPLLSLSASTRHLWSPSAIHAAIVYSLIRARTALTRTTLSHWTVTLALFIVSMRSRFGVCSAWLYVVVRCRACWGWIMRSPSFAPGPAAIYSPKSNTLTRRVCATTTHRA